MGGIQHFFFWVTTKVFDFFLEFKEKKRPILVRVWKKNCQNFNTTRLEKKKNTGEGKQISCTPFSM